ncbi:VanW family protein [Neobacillus sp. SCS-31]|uniref:VanW family protein n=1 Tax=Neobacillus oceani TaxID=3115292 RepID=UPI003906D11B
MNKNQQTLKIFVVLILSTSYVFGFSHYGPRALGALFASEKGYLPGTAVGTINLEGKTPKEALSLLQDAIADWKANNSFKLHFKEKSIELEIDRFTFDPEGTVSSIVDGRQNAVQVSLDERALIEWIEKISPSLIGEEIDLKNLGNSLTEPAKKLETGEVSFRLDRFLANIQSDQEVIASGTIDVKEPSYELELAVNELSGMKIEGNSEFSIIRALDSNGLSSLSPMALSMLATSVYIAVLETNFDILERNISKELPEYAKLGSEASVDQTSGKDFIFKNPNVDKFELSFSYIGNKLTAEIKGSKFLYEYKAVADGEEQFQPKVIKQYSPYLKDGQVKITKEGKPGSIIKMYREIYSQGNLLDTQFMGEDYYPPIHRVEVHALQDGVTQQQGGTAAESPAGNIESPPPAEGNNQPEFEIPEQTERVQAPSQQDPDFDSSDDGPLWGKPNEVPK